MKKISCLLFCIVLLSGCKSGAISDEAFLLSQLEDMELVVSAQQGRIQNLEKQLIDLDVQLQGAITQLTDLSGREQTQGIDPQVIDELKVENSQLVRLMFQSFTEELTYESLLSLFESYDTVYKLNASLDEKRKLIWVTSDSSRGELYMLKSDDNSIMRLGVFDNVKLTNWSFDNVHVIIETEVENLRKGYLVNTESGKTVASMEYRGLPIWSKDKAYFVYLNENPNIVYTGTESEQMHPAGVYIYSMRTGKFDTLDSGGNDYNCTDLSIAPDGEIKYIRLYKDGKQSHSGVRVK